MDIFAHDHTMTDLGTRCDHTSSTDHCILAQQPPNDGNIGTHEHIIPNPYSTNLWKAVTFTIRPPYPHRSGGTNTTLRFDHYTLTNCATIHDDHMRMDDATLADGRPSNDRIWTYMNPLSQPCLGMDDRRRMDTR